jgi:LysR family glycine cleavage system transcriptional activator
MPEFFASELFIPKLSEWAKLNPDINLKVETVKATEITKTTSDLSIVLASGKPNASKVHELFPIKYVAACNQQLYQQWHKSGFDALKKVPLILHKSRPWSWHKWADQININDFNPMQIIQLDSMFGVARAAQQGMGIALIPLPMSKAWFEDNSLIKIFDHELITHDKYFLVQQDDIQNRPELTTFSKWVKSNFLSAITA